MMVPVILTKIEEDKIKPSEDKNDDDNVLIVEDDKEESLSALPVADKSNFWYTSAYLPKR